MNIILSFSISLFVSLIGNLNVLYKIIVEAAKQGLKLSFNSFAIAKVIILTIIPIINLLYTLRLNILYLSNEHKLLHQLEDNGLLQRMNELEISSIKGSKNIFKIIFNQLKYHNIDVVENIEIFLEDNFNEEQLDENIPEGTDNLMEMDFSELYSLSPIIVENQSEEMKLTRKKPIKRSHIC